MRRSLDADEITRLITLMGAPGTRLVSSRIENGIAYLDLTTDGAASDWMIELSDDLGQRGLSNQALNATVAANIVEHVHLAGNS